MHMRSCKAQHKSLVTARARSSRTWILAGPVAAKMQAGDSAQENWHSVTARAPEVEQVALSAELHGNVDVDRHRHQLAADHLARAC